jgi:hypothetical protein
MNEVLCGEKRSDEQDYEKSTQHAQTILFLCIHEFSSCLGCFPLGMTFSHVAGAKKSFCAIGGAA